MYTHSDMLMYVYAIICLCIYIDMIKICGKMDKSDSYKGFSSSDISFFIPRTSSDETFF